jgi:hypothetical protein
MRVATWNLQSDKPLTSERAALFLQSMDEIAADVWVVTETWTDYCPLPGYRLVSQSSAAPDLASDRRWTAIWSRLDAESCDIRSQADRMTAGRVILPGDRDLVIVGTVLPWHFDGRWPHSEGFRSALEQQSIEWSRLSAAIDDGDFLIAGDFNQSLPHQRYYGSKQNEFALNKVMDSLGVTCATLGNDPLTNNPRIDHICVRQSRLATSVVSRVGAWPVPSINEKPITDHAGVFADLDLMKLT